MAHQQSQHSEAELNELWQDFTREATPELKHRLMLHYVWLVRYVLYGMNLPVNSILTDEDFLHIGILGLHESIERFDLDRGIKFETFATSRIRGIVLDELRRLDWLTRSARKKVQEYIQAIDSLRSSEGREVSSEEIRQKLNVSPEEYQSYLSAAAASVASISMGDSTATDDDDYDGIQEIADEDAENTLLRMAGEERSHYITRCLQKLPERKRFVKSPHYYEEMPFKISRQGMGFPEMRAHPDPA